MTAPTAVASLPPEPAIRAATLADLDALVALEERCFSLDRLTRRNFRHLLTRAHAETLVYELDGQLAGYVLLLFRQGTPLARLYSIATDPARRGRGIGEALVRAAEQAALAREALLMRLEFREDPPASIGMYPQHGSRPYGEYAGYYEAVQDALRLHKSLGARRAQSAFGRVPFYQQTLDFTCGPASLMMAMKPLDP